MDIGSLNVHLKQSWIFRPHSPHNVVKPYYPTYFTSTLDLYGDFMSVVASTVH